MRWRYLYPQAEFPYGGARRGEPTTGQRSSPSTSCSTPASSTTTATGRSPPTTPRHGPTTCCIRVTVRNAVPRTSRPSTSCRRCGSATPGRGVSTTGRPPVSRRGRHARRRAPRRSGGYVLVGTASTDGCCPATTRPTWPGCSERTTRPVTPRTGSPTTSSTAATPSTPTAAGTKAALCYRLTVAGGRVGRGRACACPRKATALGADFGTGRCAARQAEADEFYAALTPPTPRATRRR